MKLRSFFLSTSLLCSSIGASGCGDPVEKAKEAQRVFTAQEPIALPADSRPNVVTFADMNGDGSPDVVVACTGRAAVCVLLGNGKGKFTPAAGSPFAANTSPTLIAVGDFNEDKKLDVVVTSHDSNGAYLMLGDGKGGLALTLTSPFIGYPFGKPHNHGLALGDVNGDGKLDITMGHQDQGAIAVLLGDGKEKAEPAAGSPVKLGRGFYPHALADVNGDGKLDVIAPDIMGAAIVVGLGDGKGGFKLGAAYRVKQRPFYITVDDFNGDKKLDIAATHDDIQDVDVLLGDGQGGFTPAPGSPLNAGLLGWKITSTDVDGDGHKDLIIGLRGGFNVLSGDGTGAFAAKPESFNATGGSAWGIAAGDVNKDGKVDVIVTDADKGTVLVYMHKK